MKEDKTNIVRHERKKRGLNQADVAKEADMASVSLHAIEVDKTKKPNPDTLWSISRALASKVSEANELYKRFFDYYKYKMPNSKQVGKKICKACKGQGIVDK